MVHASIFPIVDTFVFLVFKAFKFPDSMNVHFQCVVQVCRGACPDPQCGGGIPVPPRSTAGTTSLNPDTYGIPQAAPLSNQQDSYGAPQASLVSSGDTYGSPAAQRLSNPAINPRLPSGGNTVYVDDLTAPGIG